MSYPDFVKNTLLNKINEMSQFKCSFVKNPVKDFTRKRKLDFETMFKILLSMESGSLRKELLEFTKYSVDTATVSAFNQQREKLLPEAFEFLFHRFNEEFQDYSTFEGYRLIACDGSHIDIAKNPDDPETHFLSNHETGVNRLHLNAFYDLSNRRYVDAIVQPVRQENECHACIQMLKRFNSSENRILIADRGYENYNLFVHAQVNGWKFVLRVKDRDSNGITSSLVLPNVESFDIDYSLLATRRRTKEIIANPEIYKYLSKNKIFDFLPVGSKGVYPINFRILRFPISDNSFEIILTNLDRITFPIEKIKEIYHLRWGIETSFRELKYAIGLTCLHSKKVNYIKQEIFARLVLYNFCEIITTHVVIKQGHTKHMYQLNYTMAIHICRYFLKYISDMSPPDVENLIKKNLLPIRIGRHDPRKVKPKSTVSFLYRVS